MKKEFTFDHIHALHNSMKSAAADVSAAEAALVAAAAEVDAAKQDDGSIAPEAILERIASAEKTQRLRTIEANRAGAKLAEAEASFHQEVLESAPNLIAFLDERASIQKKDLEGRILAIDGLDKNSVGLVSQLAGSSPAVRAIFGASASIQFSLSMNEIYAESEGGASPALVASVLAASEFV